MYGFKLDSNGDVVIRNGILETVSDGELLRQTVQTVIGTNLGEWFLNEEEGINFRNLLTKNPDMDIVRDEVMSGLIQIDETFIITEFEGSLEGRKLRVSFKAVNDSGNEVEGGYEYAV